MSSIDSETESGRTGVPPNDWHHGEENIATLSQQTSAEQSAQGLQHTHTGHDDNPLGPSLVLENELSLSVGPGENSDYSEEGEEHENYNPAPERGPELITGNGPVPREGGNIGESIGTAPGPSNGV